MPELLKPVGSMDKKCDLNISLTKKFLFCKIPNLQNCDSYFIFQGLVQYSFKINVIPKTIEKYISLVPCKLKRLSFVLGFH